MSYIVVYAILVIMAIVGEVSPAQSFGELGLGDYERESRNQFDGFIYHNRLQVKDLTEFKYFDMFCRGNYETFTQCTGDYHDIKVLYSSDKEVIFTHSLTQSLIYLNQSCRI
jgi:hypothetical protein